MKKSNRYASRYTAKLRARVEAAELLANQCHAECAHFQRSANADRMTIRNLTAQLTAKKKSFNDENQPGYAVIRIGRDEFSRHMGRMLNLSISIDVSSFRFSVYRMNSSSFTNINREVSYYCHMLTEKLEAAMIEYMVENKLT